MAIRELMQEDLITLDLKASSKTEAITELATLLSDTKRIDNLDVYIETVLKREAEFTTGIGFGVGIPHGQSDVVKNASLCFGRSIEGIAYDSMDGKPVHLLFLIAVPNSSKDEHLRILSQLSRKLMHQEVRDKLMNASSNEEIYKILEE